MEVTGITVSKVDPDLGLAIVCSPKKIDLEVVFVHGLGGSRSSTWVNRNGEFWPSWLGEALPGTRVWTYGYNSSFWKRPSEDALELHNARLLDDCVRNGVGKQGANVIFICHSLGGLLVKSSVIRIFRGVEDNQWSYLKEKVTSIIFLGTPHRGSEWANRLYLLFLGASIFWPSSQFVPLLRKGNSAILATIAEQFNNFWGNRSILTFCEGTGTGALGLIVKPQDARTNCSREFCHTVLYNHQRMVKIKSKQENTFLMITEHLKGHHSQLETRLPIPSAIQLKSGVSTPVKESSNLDDDSGPGESQGYPWKPIYIKAFRRCLQADKDDRNLPWEILDEEIDGEIEPNESIDRWARRLRLGKYMFYLPGHESTIVILTVPSTIDSMTAEWTIISPNSTYHPGRHDGHLRIPQDFPFKPPKYIWDSPILSPYVSPRGNVCLDTDGFSPARASFYYDLHVLASIVVYGPDLGNTIAPTIKFHPQMLGGLMFLERKDIHDEYEDWKIRVCNLFSRAYNRLDNEDELDFSNEEGENSQSWAKVSDAERMTSILAIEDTIYHFSSQLSACFDQERFKEDRVKLGKSDIRKDFEAINSRKKLLAVEREWVDLLNVAMDGIATHGWGVAESFDERQRRLRNEAQAS